MPCPFLLYKSPQKKTLLNTLMLIYKMSSHIYSQAFIPPYSFIFSIFFSYKIIIYIKDWLYIYRKSYNGIKAWLLYSILLFNHNSDLKGFSFGEIYIAKRGMACFGGFKRKEYRKYKWILWDKSLTIYIGRAIMG
jgi:hypothetical protein